MSSAHLKSSGGERVPRQNLGGWAEHREVRQDRRLEFSDEIDRALSVFRNATPRAVKQVPPLSRPVTSHARALWRLEDVQDFKAVFVKKKAPFLAILRSCVPQAKKYVVGETLGAPKNVNLILRVKTLTPQMEVDRTSLQDS